MLREEFRRECTFAHHYHVKDPPNDDSMTAQLNYLACAAVSACSNEINASLAAVNSNSEETRAIAS